jgi:hypothetical protein
MTDKPAAVGYVNASLLITDSELERVRVEVARFASDWGYGLTYIHVEDRGSSPDAFNGLVQQVTALDIATVLIPSLLHFAGLGSPVEVKNRLEHVIGGRVIPTSSPRSGEAGVLIPASAPVAPTTPRPCPLRQPCPTCNGKRWTVVQKTASRTAR